MYRHTNPEVQFAPPKDGALRHPELLPPADPTSASDPPAQAATGWPCTGAGGGRSIPSALLACFAPGVCYSYPHPPPIGGPPFPIPPFLDLVEGADA